MPETINFPLPILHSKNNPSGLAVTQSSITLTMGFISCATESSLITLLWLRASRHWKLL